VGTSRTAKRRRKQQLKLRQLEQQLNNLQLDFEEVLDAQVEVGVVVNMLLDNHATTPTVTPLKMEDGSPSAMIATCINADGDFLGTRIHYNNGQMIAV
jgi:hypothetical protein